MKEIIALSKREIQRIQILEQVIRRVLSLKEATPMLKVCCRQAKRLLSKYRRDGPKGLAHRRRGRAAPNALSPTIRRRVLELRQNVYVQLKETQGWEPRRTPKNFVAAHK